MRQDGNASLNRLDNPRFGGLGMSTKWVMGVLVIVMTWLSLGFGFIAFGGFLYLHLLLRIKHNSPYLPPEDDVVAPIDGRVLAVRRDRQGVQIDMAGELTGSQIIYAPLAARIEDKLWIDGAYLPFEDSGSHPLNARYDYMLTSQQGHVVSLSIFGARYSRYINAPFVEGQFVTKGEPFAFGLFRSYVTVHLPADYDVMISDGAFCIAQQSCIARPSSA